MYLATLTAQRFRSCLDVSIPFRSTLTALVGENNAGKSNIINALRLVTTPSDGKRNRYFDPSDISRLAPQQDCMIEARFEQVSDAQEGDYIGARLAPDSRTILLGATYVAPERGERLGSTEYTAGPHRALDQKIPGRKRIRHVYLPPLRDAKRVLSSGYGDRVAFILRSLQDDPSKVDELEAEAKAAFNRLAKHKTIRDARNAIQSPLKRLTEGVDLQDVGLGFADPDLLRLALVLCDL